MKTSRSGKQKSIFAALRLADLVLEFSLGRYARLRRAFRDLVPIAPRAAARAYESAEAGVPYLLSWRSRSASAGARCFDGSAATNGVKSGLSVKIPNIGAALCSERFDERNPSNSSMVRSILS